MSNLKRITIGFSIIVVVFVVIAIANVERYYGLTEDEIITFKEMEQSCNLLKSETTDSDRERIAFENSVDKMIDVAKQARNP